MKRGKKYRAALEKIEPNRKYTLEEAITTLKGVAFAKFDETV
jgi:large subunit ribosomal protein L1